MLQELMLMEQKDVEKHVLPKANHIFREFGIFKSGSSAFKLKDKDWNSRVKVNLESIPVIWIQTVCRRTGADRNVIRALLEKIIEEAQTDNFVGVPITEKGNRFFEKYGDLQTKQGEIEILSSESVEENAADYIGLAYGSLNLDKSRK